MKRHTFFSVCAPALMSVAVAVSAQEADAASGPALTVDLGAARYAISPDIYGLNFAESAIADELALPVDRWGGNGTERYNWQLGSTNLAQDYFFENIADCFLNDTDCSQGNPPYYREFVARDLARGTQALMQLPMMGFVAKNAPTDHPFTCSFPATQFPDQQSFDEFDLNCGNGISGGGVPLTANPTTASVAVGTAFAAGWVSDLKTRGVHLFELGNEPALWNDTHRDAHPDPVSYDELFAKSRALAVAVKNADTAAKVVAFSEWGWLNYFCSAADFARENGCSADSPDRAAHGGTPLADWLLQQFSNDDQLHHRRLIDYFDLHYYRQDPETAPPNANKAAGYTADVTRSLWDPGFTDPSYIDEKIRLLPRMRELVNNNYPGTKIALTEYNLSIPGKDRLNAVIQADVLGIFAREKLDLATRFGVPDDGTASALDHIYDAFRLYRNYDGAGSKFGDSYVRSTSADQRKLAVYAAQRSSDGKLTVVVLNKTGGALTSTMNLKGRLLSLGTTQVWQWTGDGIERKANRLVINGTILTYPKMSMTLLVFPAK